MSKYRQTYNALTGPIGSTTKIQAQEPLERLKLDDPIWCNRRVWITYETVFTNPLGPERLNLRVIPATDEDFKQWTKHQRGLLT